MSEKFYAKFRREICAWNERDASGTSRLSIDKAFLLRDAIAFKKIWKLRVEVSHPFGKKEFAARSGHPFIVLIQENAVGTDGIPGLKARSFDFAQDRLGATGEGERWFAFEEELSVSRSQLRAFENLYKMNTRPEQDAHGRKIEANE